MLVRRALNDTKKSRKAGADIFANIGLEKPETILFSGFFPKFPVDLAQNPLNPRTNGWPPNGRSPSRQRVFRSIAWVA